MTAKFWCLIGHNAAVFMLMMQSILIVITAMLWRLKYHHHAIYMLRMFLKLKYDNANSNALVPTVSHPGLGQDDDMSNTDYDYDKENVVNPVWWKA